MIFSKGDNITQRYGSNIGYYKTVSNGALTRGHEGLDIIPADSKDDWTIHALDDGVVIRDVDNPRDGGVYGNLCVIENKAQKRALWYCHQSANFISVGQTVKRGDPIAKMGSTGNSSGAHLHLNYVQTDGNGNRQNQNDGMLGYLDPYPLYIQLITSSIPASMQDIRDYLFDIAIHGIYGADVDTRKLTEGNIRDKVKEINSWKVRSGEYDLTARDAGFTGDTNGLKHGTLVSMIKNLVKPDEKFTALKGDIFSFFDGIKAKYS